MAAILSPFGSGAATEGLGVTAAGMGLGFATVPMPPNNVQTLFTQQVIWMLVTAPSATAVTKLGLLLGRAGVTPDGTGISEMGIWTEAGVLQKATGDMSAAFQTAVVGGYTAITGTLTSSFTPVAGANYYIGALTSFSGTAPQAATNSTGGLALSPVNGHYLALVSTATGITTMPASFTPSAQTALGGIAFMWAQ